MGGENDHVNRHICNMMRRTDPAIHHTLSTHIHKCILQTMSQTKDEKVQKVNLNTL